MRACEANVYKSEHSLLFKFVFSSCMCMRVFSPLISLYLLLRELIEMNRLFVHSCLLTYDDNVVDDDGSSVCVH